jgi:hypothetical protein
VTFRFSASEMGHRMDPLQDLGDSRGNTKENWTSAFNPSWVSPCLMVLGRLDLEDLKVPYLSTSNVLKNVRTK